MDKAAKYAADAILGVQRPIHWLPREESGRAVAWPGRKRIEKQSSST